MTLQIETIVEIGIGMVCALLVIGYLIYLHHKPDPPQHMSDSYLKDIALRKGKKGNHQ